MDKKQAKALKTLLDRPDLALEERQALRELLQGSGNLPKLELDLAAFKRRGPASARIRLCLDFGTAMSKAWATGRGAIETLPLLIGKAAGADGLIVPSSVYIDDNGRIYIGYEAERQHRADARSGRPRFDNLKRMLSEAEVGTELKALPLREGIDPTDSGITGGDLLILYLAWLTDLSECALEEAITATKGGISVKKSEIRAIGRRFAIPCFESTDGQQGQARYNWAQNVMIDALLRAQVLADSLRGKWVGLTTWCVADLMRKLYALNVNRLRHLITNDCSVREPIAAGASRFDAVLGNRREPAPVPIRQYLMVVDAGAGTTDFALFQAITPIGESHPSYALLRKSVRMCRIAGNEIDAILRPLVLKACGVDPAKLSADDFSYAAMDLDSQIREIKRNLFDRKSVTVDLRPNLSGTISLRTLLADSRMQKDGTDLVEMRNDILLSVFSLEQRDAIRIASGGKPIQIYVLLTGGSCTIPIIGELAEGIVELDATQFRFTRVDRLPEWVDRLPRGTAQLLADVYPQCAVAVGGSVPALPIELRDLELAITPPHPGRRTLTRFPITGT
jgi:hypothetical protein